MAGCGGACRCFGDCQGVVMVVIIEIGIVTGGTISAATGQTKGGAVRRKQGAVIGIIMTGAATGAAVDLTDSGEW